uniref:BED-type domain-containing protein n=1 Tax=Arundo donax TaxID=35708 RepID=A0A0A9GRD7_ARUDO
MKGRCKHCDELIGAKHGSGTSALLKHLTRCKKQSQALRVVQDLSSTIRSPNGACLKNWSYEPQVARRVLLRMVSLHGIPFTFTEYDGFRRFVERLV